MKNIKIKNNIYYVGANDKERRIFDQLIPLPDGTTYNAYIIKGSNKIALIDSVDPSKKEVLLGNLKHLNLSKIDYVISHHGEQDHSGSIPDILKIYPMAKVLTNQKCKSELMDLLLIKEDNFATIEDGQEVSLGDKTLKFVFTPWVHWPETFITLLIEDKILFTCDFFGSHFAFEADKGLFVNDQELIFEPAKRYYAEIMSPFRSIIRKNLEKAQNLEFEIIAPSHGPLYKGYDYTQFIMNCYKEWSSDDVKNEVLLVYISMHGSTNKIVAHFISELKKRGIEVKAFDLSNADIGNIAMELIDAATVVIGTPTVLTGPHPNAVFAAYLVKALRPKTKFLSVIGSYGWGGKTVDFLADLLSGTGAEILEPVLIKGYPKDNDLELIKKLADNILQKHAQIGLI